MEETQAGGLRQLKWTIELPGVAGASDVHLDVSGTARRASLSVPGKYRLRIDLPCAVTEQPRARWRKKAQQLEVLLTAR